MQQSQRRFNSSFDYTDTILLNVSRFGCISTPIVCQSLWCVADFSLSNEVRGFCQLFRVVPFAAVSHISPFRISLTGYGGFIQRIAFIRVSPVVQGKKKQPLLIVAVSKGCKWSGYGRPNPIVLSCTTRRTATYCLFCLSRLGQREWDLNPRTSAYEANEIPDFSIPHYWCFILLILRVQSFSRRCLTFCFRLKHDAKIQPFSQIKQIFISKFNYISQFKVNKKFILSINSFYVHGNSIHLQVNFGHQTASTQARFMYRKRPWSFCSAPLIIRLIDDRWWVLTVLIL